MATYLYERPFAPFSKPMRGTIIHYDTLTECGLLKTEAGQIHYFRRGDVATATGLAAGGYVALRANAPADTGGSQMDIGEGLAAVRHVEQVRRGSALATVAAPRPLRPAYGWVGGWLSLASLLCLLLTGGHPLGEPAGYGSPNPRLIESVFGVAAAGLLVGLSVLFFMNKPRRPLRWTYWLVVWLSLFAYVAQTLDGFEADMAATVYAYSLLALFFAVYILSRPKR